MYFPFTHTITSIPIDFMCSRGNASLGGMTKNYPLKKIKKFGVFKIQYKG